MDQMSQTTAAFEADRVSRATDLFEAPPIAQANDHVYDRGFVLLFWGAYLVFAVALYAVTGYLVYRLVGAFT